MKITAGNLFSNLQATPTEQFSELLRGRAFRCEQIVSTGQATPPGEWMDQDDDEWVVLLSGHATLSIAGEAAVRMLHPGDWLLLPAHCRHRVESTDPTQPTVWLAIHYQL